MSANLEAAERLSSAITALVDLAFEHTRGALTVGDVYAALCGALAVEFHGAYRDDADYAQRRGAFPAECQQAIAKMIDGLHAKHKASVETRQ